jgi:hypothetical protein
MPGTEQMWREKSDNELQHAVDHPSDYAPEDIQMILTELTRRGMAAAARKRYQDGYRVSNTIVGIGNAIKIIGIIIALLFVVAGVAIFGVRAGSIVAVLIIAALVAIVSFTLGVLVSAQGQILRAGLDVAVYSSTFLKDKDRAAIMGLHSMAGQ